MTDIIVAKIDRLEDAIRNATMRSPGQNSAGNRYFLGYLEGLGKFVTAASAYKDDPAFIMGKADAIGDLTNDD